MLEFFSYVRDHKIASLVLAAHFTLIALVLVMPHAIISVECAGQEYCTGVHRVYLFGTVPNLHVSTPVWYETYLFMYSWLVFLCCVSVPTSLLVGGLIARIITWGLITGTIFVGFIVANSHEDQHDLYDINSDPYIGLYLLFPISHMIIQNTKDFEYPPGAKTPYKNVLSRGIKQLLMVGILLATTFLLSYIYNI